MLKRSLILFSLVFFGVACQESRVEEVKSFRIYVATDTPALKYSIQILVDDYNRRAGTQTLSVVDNKDDSTSLMHFRKGLIDDGRKLGLGQWTAMQKQSVDGTFARNQTTTIEYGMDVVFDYDNFLKKSAYIQDPESNEYKHLFHLFAHEVGHGMQMDHSNEVSSVMFPSIPENGSREVDYDAYFQVISEFMNDPTKVAISQHDGEEAKHHHDEQAI